MSRTEAQLIYDGDCPFCSAYVRLMRLRDNIDLTLIDARAGGELVDTVRAAGYDLNEGFVLHLGDRYYHGDDCLHTLALLSSRSGLLNRLNAVIFRHAWAARLLYPVLRSGRNLTLRLLGIRRIEWDDAGS